MERGSCRTHIHCPACTLHAQALEERGTGLVVSERLINVPPKVAPPLVQFLFDELADAAKAADLDKASGCQRVVLPSMRMHMCVCVCVCARVRVCPGNSHGGQRMLPYMALPRFATGCVNTRQGL